MPGWQTSSLLLPVLLQGARALPPISVFLARWPRAAALVCVEICRSHRRLPLLVARIDGGHVEESGDAVELFPHLN